METCKQIALNFINNYNGWVNKGELCALAQKEGYSPENICRRCRELVNEGKVEVSYYKGKRHQTLARYAKIGEEKPMPPTNKITIEIKNGLPTAVVSTPPVLTGTYTIC